MRLNYLKAILRTAVHGATVLLLGAGVAGAQQVVNLTAAPTTATLPDGSAVPMWGYSCGAIVTGSTAACAAANPNAAGGWSPVILTVPTGQTLQINLTNGLTFPTSGTTLPTSLVIVGQLGGGLGTSATSTPSPDHTNAQGSTTWPIAGGPGATAPAQGNRVQSFSTEVAAGATTSLTWTTPRPGTYLLESGSHPSIQGAMGLIGMVVVTTAPSGTTAGTAYPAAGTVPAVTYNAEVPLIFSEIDPVQNNAVNTAVNTAGFSETMAWSGQPGGCGFKGSATYNQCYPPVVNYSPLYYLINGVALNKSSATTSLFATAPATGVTGNVLVRFVNAGLRMHIPSIVGSVTGATPVGGFSLIAEDGNPLPGLARVQSEVFMAAGKTYDVMINVPAAGGTALPVYDRQLSLSGNATARDAGMLAYIGVNGSSVPAAPSLGAAIANADSYGVVPGNTLVISDPAKGVIANDVNVYGVKVLTAPTKGVLTLNADGTFTYVPNAGWTAPDSFVYQANGTGPTATVTLGAAAIEAGSGITVNPITYTSNMATFLKIASPGILSVDKDAAGYALTVNAASVTPAAGLTVTVDAYGGFNATVASPGTYSFTYKAQNTQGTLSASAATVTLVFPTPSNLKVSVVDGLDHTTAITDYRWIIEEDRTFNVDPNCTTNPPPAGCPTAGGIVPTFGTNFHTSYMPVVATGCTGTLSCETGQSLLGTPTVCNIGNGICDPSTTNPGQQTAVDPSKVVLNPAKRYYISVLPGDAANPFESANLVKGHGMGGAPIAAGQTAVTVQAVPTPFPPAKLSVFVFEDDFPLNGEQDGGGGVDTLSPNEPGLGSFNITIMDDAGGPGDATGQVDYDMFNQPLANALPGTLDPVTHVDACPISKAPRQGTNKDQTGITGTIVTCPKYESDGVTLSPLAGQAVVANMMPGRYGIVATPAADRIARGEEWLQTNTLDGQKAHDSFLKIGEAGYFQEYGPAGYHVSIGFANPKIINGRKSTVCGGTDPNLPGTGNCTNSLTGLVTTSRMSRTPDERLYSSGDNSSFSFTQCYVSFGDADGEDFAFSKCNADGTFTLTGLPDGDWRLTVFDQWNDMLVDGLSTPVRLAGGALVNLGQIATNQWQANIYTTTFFDANKNGVRDPGEEGLALVPTNVRFRDGSFSNFNNTDLDGYAGFNEEFPLFNWYVVETDPTRYKNTGTHVVYDAGGPADGTPCGSATTPASAPCGTSNIASMLANTVEQISVPANLRVPGAVYCATADCTGHSIAAGPASSDPPAVCTTSSTGVTSCSTTLSTGRIDPPWVLTEGWQGFSGQNSFLEFGKTPYAVGENGGIRGHVVYASTRPFDDPQLLLQLSWEPLIPNVTINLYKEGTAPDGTISLTMVDSTRTSSFDDWAQGFRTDGVPNMNCPGQGTNTGTNPDLFYFSLFNQPNWLDTYNATYNGGTAHTIPNGAQFKCYDGMHNWNQLQPAPYDGMYQFPSIAGRNPSTGVPAGGSGSVAGTNCNICVANPTDGTPMLPSGKYVVEVVVPPGYELVKEEDKNILIGDNFIAPVTVEFPGLGGSIYILPDQAAVADTYNSNNSVNPTQNLGRTTLPSHEADTGQLESYWPCVGASRTVPDFISLFPASQEVAPFAGATRNLCDRKEVQLDDQTSALAKFYLFTSTHVAAHFTGVITDDYTSEFDPYSPQFGEKFAPPDLPISVKDWTGNEVARVYSDHWGAYDGLTYSTWEVNPPNPTGYSPTMMVTCMNDPGTGATPDPLFNPQYSQFCYEIPFMPGQTQYMDTPVVPTSAFAGAGYNNPDCSYPALTPAVASVTSNDIAGPWVSAAGHTLTINALGDQMVPNNAYAGPSATTPPYNQKKILRHYGFGASQGTGGVTIGGQLAAVTSWSDTQINVVVPTGVANCGITQQAQYGGSVAQCGELLITAGNGKQSVDAVTVTIGGKKPTLLAAGTTIQSAIDAAAPGDMIIVPPGTYTEMILMWKPVRLQGVGAASAIINANTHPEGRLDDWRRRVNCLFGLALNGTPIAPASATNPAGNPYDPTGTYTCGTGLANFKQFNGLNPQVDRLPLEATVGWDATLNGNLAELLQEPTLMGALEGAAITVLSKGVTFPSNPFAADTFPTGTQLLDGSTNSSHGCGPNTATAKNPFPSNFMCNPSRIDGLGITDSSQGGGGIFVHAWGHYLEISNNRVYNNAGTLSGGINVGQGEFPPAYLAGTANAATNAAPGSCESSNAAGLVLPYCHDIHVSIHNNAIVSNSSTGDELFSATPAGAGGVSFCTGSDYYQFNYNWVCGNLSTGDGGGLGHLGFIKNGDIEHNSFLFNQSTNPTIPTNGGGVLIMGAPDVDPPCSTVDQDCVGAPNLIGPSDGSGPGTVINANLIMGNAADSGSGGGLRLQNINGSDVITFPTTPANWNTVSVTNNIITNNVAGWDGAGISVLDALNTNIINNTIASNDTTASSGVLFNTLGAPIASANGPCGTDPNTGLPAKNPCVTESHWQPAGLVSIQNSAVLVANMPATITCPAGHFTTASASNGDCRTHSVPELYNNVLWQNRTFHIGVGGLGNGGTNQQNVVSLYVGDTTTAAPSQPQAISTTANGAGIVVTGGTGACVPGTGNNAYWDIGVRGDTSPSNHSGGLLNPTYSVITDVADYSAAAQHNSGGNPTFVSQYCNGSRVPPELGTMGYQVPPGISDATVPNPIFSLTPAATVDEGNNWINLSWGPLAMTSPANGTTLGTYGPTSTSSTINYIPSTATTYAAAPSTDFFGNLRKTNNAVDAGAVEYATPAAASLRVTPTSLVFGNVVRGTTSAVQNLTLSNTGNAQATGITVVVTAPFAQSGGTCGATLNAGATCTIGVVFSPTSTTSAATGSATITANVAVTNSPVSLTGTGVAPVVSATLTPTSHAYGNAPRGVGVLQAPSQVFTLTNTGNVTLTGIGQGALGGTNPTEFAVVRLASTCGPATGGQLLGQTTLAPGASCVVTVQFRPLTTQTTGAKAASVSVNDAAGTQTSTLTGTAQ
jgi:Bacterial Ig domain